MAKRTAGTRWEDPKTPLKTAAQIAGEADKVATTEKFPATLSDSIALMKKVSATEVKSQEDWEALQPRLQAIKLHVHKLQQGLPILDSKSTDFNHQQMYAVMQEKQLEQLALTNPMVKELLDQIESLKKSSVTAGDNIPDEDLAGAIYTAYCVSVGGKAYNGDSLPLWKDFVADDEKKLQVAAWISGAVAAKQLLTSPKTEPE